MCWWADKVDWLKMLVVPSKLAPENDQKCGYSDIVVLRSAMSDRTITKRRRPIVVVTS